jgi:suppressor of G2 allele of SKP1
MSSSSSSSISKQQRDSEVSGTLQLLKAMMSGSGEERKINEKTKMNTTAYNTNNATTASSATADNASNATSNTANTTTSSNSSNGVSDGTSSSSSSGSSSVNKESLLNLYWREGDDAYINDNYQHAYDLYSEALRYDEKSIIVMLHRAAASLKLKKYVKAEYDAKRVIQLDKFNVSGYFRASQALFYQERYSEASSMLKKAKIIYSKQYADKADTSDATVQLQTIELWIRKTDAELQRNTPASTSAVTASSSSSAASATTPSSKIAATTAKPTATPSSSSSSAASTTSATPAPTPSPVSTIPQAEKVTHNFYQFGVDVVVTIFAKNVEQNKASVSVNEDGTILRANITMPDDSVYSKEWHLYAPVDPSQTSLRITPYKLEYNMKKKAPGEWRQLESTTAAAKTAITSSADSDTPASTSTATDTSSSSSSSKLPSAWTTKKNWDAVEKDVEKEESEAKPEGDAALQKLFQDVCICISTTALYYEFTHSAPLHSLLLVLLLSLHTDNFRMCYVTFCFILAVVDIQER